MKESQINPRPMCRPLRRAATAVVFPAKIQLHKPCSCKPFCFKLLKQQAKSFKEKVWYDPSMCLFCRFNIVPLKKAHVAECSGGWSVNPARWNIDQLWSPPVVFLNSRLQITFQTILNWNIAITSESFWWLKVARQKPFQDLNASQSSQKWLYHTNICGLKYFWTKFGKYPTTGEKSRMKWPASHIRNTPCG